MQTLKALDLFCGAGGASSGLAQSGFSVTGVDIRPQKNYPYTFILQDCLTLSVDFLRGFDFIWASPPCQKFSAMTRGRWQDREHPDHITPIRKLLIASGVPYCIENVVGAPLLHPVLLCGSMFNLQTKHGSQLRRHRLFECSFPVTTLTCNHNTSSAIGVYGGGQHPNRRRITPTIGVYGHSGGSSTRDGLSFFTTQDRRDAMGIQWMSGSELSQSIPPAYSHYISQQFLTCRGEKAGISLDFQG